MNSIGMRVAAALRASGLTQKDLARRVGMTPDALSRALSGKRGFAAVELAAIAGELACDVHELITGEANPHARVVAARHAFDHASKARSLPGAESDSTVCAGIQLAYEQIDGIVPTPPLAVDPVSMRKRLGEGFSRHFADRLAACDVDVIALPELEHAYSMRIAGRCVIAVGASGNWFFENWSIAHELAHLALGHDGAGFLHDAQAPDSTRDRHEAEANAYAAELLLPEQRIRELDWPAPQEGAIADLLWDAGVSTKALHVRMKALGIVSAPQTAALLDSSTQVLLNRYAQNCGADSRAVARRMQAAAARSFPDWLVAAHLTRVRIGDLAPGTLAWMLGVGVDELDIETPTSPPMSSDELLSLLH